MTIKGILFDLYGTLIDIETDESKDEIYRTIAHYLTYQGVYLHRGEIRERYYQIMRQQREAGGEEYAEIDVEAIWNELLMQEGIRFAPIRGQLARVLAQVYRAISRNRLQLYPGVKEVLNTLRTSYRLGLVTDAQSQPEVQYSYLTRGGQSKFEGAPAQRVLPTGHKLVAGTSQIAITRPTDKGLFASLKVNHAGTEQSCKVFIPGDSDFTLSAPFVNRMNLKYPG